MRRKGNIREKVFIVEGTVVKEKNERERERERENKYWSGK